MLESLKLEVRSVKSIVLQAIVAHAQEAAPDECCGVLLGRGGVIVEAVRARNVASSPATKYAIDAKDHIDARRSARSHELDVVGFYHSHPAGSASPSATDVDEASYPGHVYAIVGLAATPPEVRVFTFESGNFREHPLVTVG